jgi:4-hydroxy-tetrahydrodipicolinate synthase
MHDLCAAALAGDANAAKLMNDALMPLHGVMFVESNPIPVKYAMFLMGLAEEGIRLPLTVLDQKFHDQLKRELESAGLI